METQLPGVISDLDFVHPTIEMGSADKLESYKF